LKDDKLGDFSNMEKENGVRVDERADDETRVLSCKTGVLSKSQGSCEFSLSNTSVLCSVHGPAESKNVRKELIDRSYIEVFLKPVQGQQGSKERDHEATIQGILNEVCKTENFPRTVITVTLQVISSDGSLLSCAVLAAIGALMDAGIPMYAIPSASSCAITNDGRLVLDQDENEELNAKGTVFACTKNDNGEFLSICSDGILTQKELGSSLELCSRGCAITRAFLTQSMKDGNAN